MNGLMKACVMGAAALAIAQSANAAITINSSWTPQYPFTDNSQPSASEIQTAATALGVSLGSELYTVTQSLTESGLLTGSYSSVYTAVDNNQNPRVPATMTITYDPGTMYAIPSVLLVKGGNSDALLFKITGWDGKEQLIINADFLMQKNHPDKYQDISHVTFYGGSRTPGNPPGGTPVPEPSTYFAGLSALGMLFLGFKNRK